MKPLIFGTSYIGHQDMAWLVRKWARLAAIQNPGVDMLLVDSASPFDPRQILFDPPVAPDRRVTVAQLGDNVGHLSRGGKDGWGRAFTHGLQCAIDGGYTHAAYVDSDILLTKPVTLELKRMEKNGVKIACPWEPQYFWCENGIVLVSLKYAKDTNFIERYDWESVTPAELPEHRFERLAKDDLFLLPWRGLRDDFNRLTLANIGEMDFVTHCANRGLYERFLQVKGFG